VRRRPLLSFSAEARGGGACAPFVNNGGFGAKKIKNYSII